jgi:hypothetical protein
VTKATEESSGERGTPRARLERTEESVAFAIRNTPTGPSCELGLDLLESAGLLAASSCKRDRPDAGGMDALCFTATNAAELRSSRRAFSETVCCGCIN